MNIKQQFKEGLVTNNPVLVQLLGMCATMAITTSLFNGVGMGFSVLIILTCCNVVISLIRKIIPNDIRLAIFVLVIAGFVTIVDLLLKAYIPALSESLGVFIPLIVVNCIIIGRAEAFCQKNPVGASFFDGIFQGLGYTCVLAEHTGFVAPRHVGSSWTRNRSCVHCAGRQILYHWGTARASPQTHSSGPDLEFLTMMATFLHEVPRALNIPRLVRTSERSTPPDSQERTVRKGPSFHDAVFLPA